MNPRKYSNRPPARSAVPVPPPARDSSALPVVLTPADEVEILTAQRLPRLWLHVTLVFPGGPDPARAALGAAWFATRLRAIDKRLRLTVDRRRCAATNGELVLAFAPQRGGSLAAEWLEEVKPLVRELAVAEFEGAEVKSVAVVKEE